MSIELLEKPENVKELIDNAVNPEEWKKHLENDLMKFWYRPDAYDTDGDLFSTYRTNSGEKLPKNKEDWPEEFKAAIANEDTKGLVQPEYNFVRAHSRQTYAYGIAFHMTGNLVIWNFAAKEHLLL